jgi:hypothetical protein
VASDIAVTVKDAVVASVESADCIVNVPPPFESFHVLSHAWKSVPSLSSSSI